MKIKLLSIVLAVVLSFPIQSIAVNAYELESEQDTESSNSETQQIKSEEQAEDITSKEELGRKENQDIEEVENESDEDNPFNEESENEDSDTKSNTTEGDAVDTTYDEILEEKSTNTGIEEDGIIQEDYLHKKIIEELDKEIDGEQEKDLTVEVLDEEIQQASDFYVSNGVLIRYDGKSENVVIPGNLGIKEIGDSAFLGSLNRKIESVTIPEGVITIREKAFANQNLVSVTLPNSLMTIGNYAFNSNRYLKNMNIPGKVKTIGDGAFRYCDLLEKVKIPDSVTFIGKEAFYHCTSLKDVKLSNKINSIGKKAFDSCTQLETIKIPGSLRNLGSGVFRWCSNLKTVTIENGLKKLEVNTFEYCRSLTKVSLPESLNIIESSVFSNCNNLASITIPSKVTEIGSYVFYICSSLEEVKFLGNAPSTSKSSGIFSNTSDRLKVYYLATKTGFTNPWCNKPTQIFSLNINEINSFVKSLYKKILERTPKSSEVKYYADLLITQQITGADAGKNFVFSKEFKNKKLSNSAYIDVLYYTFMGRTPDKGGKAYWKKLLDNGVSREYVFKGFVESLEFTNICKSYTINRGKVKLEEPRDQNANVTMFVSRCYQKALGRKSDTAGLNYYSQEILLKRVTPLQVSQNFIHSLEFKNKNLSNSDYVKVLYRTFMGREADKNGLNYHLNRMKKGTSRNEILLGFAYSPEFKSIMKGFGL